MKSCFNCHSENDEKQSFCGTCGSPLELSDYISTRVTTEVSNLTRDRNVVETESAIKIFERAYGWVKIVAGIAVSLVAIVAGVFLWKASDLWTSVDKAKQSVLDTSKQTSKQLHEVASHARGDIEMASKQATEASKQAAIDASALSQKLQRTAVKTTSQLRSEEATVKHEVENSEVQLAAVNRLQPQFQAMQFQLGEATKAIAAQQKALSSSQEFAKQIFSSRVTEYYFFDPPVTPRSVVDPVVGPSGDRRGMTILYMLLPSVPIPGTLQLQWKYALQPPNSYYTFDNVLVFHWSDPIATLIQAPVTVSYFPDSTNRDLINELSVRDGRVYAGDQPMLKFGRPDGDFKGNKWLGEDRQPRVKKNN